MLGRSVAAGAVGFAEETGLTEVAAEDSTAKISSADSARHAAGGARNFTSSMFQISATISSRISGLVGKIFVRELPPKCH